MAQKIADKMAAAAERRAKIYGKNKAKKDEESVIGTMASILATSDGIPITEVLKLTFPQVLIQLNSNTNVPTISYTDYTWGFWRFRSR